MASYFIPGAKGESMRVTRNGDSVSGNLLVDGGPIIHWPVINADHLLASASSVGKTRLEDIVRNLLAARIRLQIESKTDYLMLAAEVREVKNKSGLVLGYTLRLIPLMESEIESVEFEDCRTELRARRLVASELLEAGIFGELALELYFRKPSEGKDLPPLVDFEAGIDHNLLFYETVR
ncbi:MAG: hypothetical protein HY220_00315 [Candidatus Sungbacteria bacterium]|uniref:Uncharacterized protein n=1 Tax=Candidatus Sungiibacteriota bacterium TaxID=2750080 RepID=A0A9D6LSB8_9BACT|nr:hypothetical protein [Candidatus Sungbacteria bacterium]